MTQFVLAFFTIHDRASYDRYAELATPIFIREGVKALANDEAPQVITPGIEADKVVLLEFRDKDHLRDFFALPDYIEATKFRDAATTMNVIQFERFAGI